MDQLRDEIKENWTQEIKELEKFFKNYGQIKTPLKLNEHGTIINAEKFLKGHFRTLIIRNGQIQFKPYLNRLKTLKTILENASR